MANAFRKFGNRNDMWKKLVQLRKNTPAELHKADEWKVLAGEIMPWKKQTVREMFPDKMGSVSTHEQFISKDIGRRVVIAGFISDLRLVNSKRGNMYLLKVDDSGSTFSVVCWNDRYKILQDKGIELEIGLPVKVSGQKNLSHMDEEQLTLGGENSSYIKTLL